MFVPQKIVLLGVMNAGIFSTFTYSHENFMILGGSLKTCFDTVFYAC
jgi:hypothetical protein